MTQPADTVPYRARASRRGDVYPVPTGSVVEHGTPSPFAFVGSTFPTSTPSTTAAIPPFTRGPRLNQRHFLHTC